MIVVRAVIRRAAAALVVGCFLVPLGSGAAVAVAPAPPGPPGSGGSGNERSPAEIIIKINISLGYSVSDVTADNPVAVESALVGSRGIYLARSTDARYTDDPAGVARFAALVARDPAVTYAEPNYVLGLDDTRWHVFGDGSYTNAGTDPAVWSGQVAASQLGLVAAQTLSQGTGVTVAVLDTGVDRSHPVLADRLLPGWDYVDDDADPSDTTDGVDDDHDGVADEAYGHGTFVAGTIALVSPGVKILPERVLDPDGFGNIFVIAQAILDAVNDGATVINLSFGTSVPIPSHLLDDAIGYAQAHGAIVVAAAGNDFSNRPHFPAASRGVLSVSALGADGSSLASFADFGPWVDVAAPGTAVVGPVPGGGYASWDGTSMAAPFVAGQAALIESSHPAMTGQQIVDLINRTASRMGRVQLAFGQINIPASLQSKANCAGPRGC